MIWYRVVFKIPNTEDEFIEPITVHMRRALLDQMRLPPDARSTLEVSAQDDDTTMFVDMRRVVMLTMWKVEP